MESKKKAQKKVAKKPTWKTRKIKVDRGETEVELEGFARISSQCMYDIYVSFEKGLKSGILLTHKETLEYHCINQPIYITTPSPGFIVVEEFN